MTTYDVEFGYGNGWVAIVPIGAFAYIHNEMSRTVYYKFGIDSSTNGVALKKGEYIKVSETVYFKDNASAHMRLTVIGE